MSTDVGGTVDPRFYVPWTGVVTDNADPDGLDRVRLSVPGLIPESKWVFPLGTAGGGSPQSGGHVPVKTGATVTVFFMGGDREEPRYLAGWWGVREDSGSEMPAPARDAGAEAHKVASLQWGGWTVAIDERSGQLTIAPDDDPETAIVFERPGPGGRLFIQADNIVIRARGVFDVQALAINLNERAVLPNGRVIG